MEGISLLNDQVDNSERETSVALLTLAKERANKLLGSMIKKIGVDIPEEFWPQIILNLDDSLTSHYRPENNTINLHSSDIEDGIAYGEELAHFIRCHLEQENKHARIDDYNYQMAVDEFFGRLGESVARELASGLDLAGLFEMKERSFFDGNDKVYQELEAGVESGWSGLEKLKRAIETNRGFKIDINKRIKIFYEKLEQAEGLCGLAEKGGLTLRSLSEEIFTLLREGGGGLIELSAFARRLIDQDASAELMDILAKILTLSSSNLEHIGMIADDYGEVGDETILDLSPYDEIKRDLDFLKTICDYELFDLSSPDFRLLRLIRKTESSLYHSVGYAAAENFVRSNPDWGDNLSRLYQLPSQDVFNQHIGSEDFTRWLKNNKALAGLARRVEFLEEINDLLCDPLEED